MSIDSLRYGSNLYRPLTKTNEPSTRAQGTAGSPANKNNSTGRVANQYSKTSANQIINDIAMPRQSAIESTIHKTDQSAQTADSQQKTSPDTGMPIFDENGKSIDGIHDIADFTVKPTYTGRLVTGINGQFSEEVRAQLEPFFNPDKDLSGLQDILNGYVDHAIEFNKSKGYIDTLTKEDVEDILKQVYLGFKARVSWTGVIVNYKEGAEKYPDARFYLNTDIYFRSLEIIEALEQFAANIIDQYGLEGTVMPEPNSTLDFIQTWANMHAGGSETLPVPPPKGLILAYAPTVYPPGSIESGHVYTIEATDPKTGEGGLIKVFLPEGIDVFRNEFVSLWDYLGGRPSEPPTLWDFTRAQNYHANAPRLDVSSLIDLDAPGTVFEKVADFIVEHCYNVERGALSIQHGQWYMEAEVPFSTPAGVSSIKSDQFDFANPNSENFNQEVANFLKNYTFRSFGYQE